MSRYQTSEALWERAKRSLAGGVSSNVRASGQPLYFQRAEGSRMFDVDGNSYLDFTLAQGPMLLGHSPAVVLDAVERAMRQGQLYAGQHELEIALAEKIQAVVSCAELVRFSSSGSEAVHAAVRLARAHTGRDKVLKFEGHYHGWYDDQLISVQPPVDKAGDRAHPKPVLATAGQSYTVLEMVIVTPWNDIDLLREVIERHSDEIAALIMEPVMCNVGCIPPQPGFLEAARELCSAHGIVLIFDEVITGFRLSLGGAQGYYGVMPDLATFGKAMANGFPMSCLAGKRAFMERIATQQVNHSGTYNSNVMVTAAALASVSELERLAPEGYPRLHRLGGMLQDGLRDLARRLGVDVLIQGVGPVFHLAFTEQTAITDYRSFLAADAARGAQFAAALLDKGIRILPRGLWYLSMAHTEEDIAMTLETVETVWAEMLERDAAVK